MVSAYSNDKFFDNIQYLKSVAYNLLANNCPCVVTPKSLHITEHFKHLLCQNTQLYSSPITTVGSASYLQSLTII